VIGTLSSAGIYGGQEASKQSAFSFSGPAPGNNQYNFTFFKEKLDVSHPET
jgi:hypothetical protein